MVAAASSAPVQDQEAQQASAQELQSLRDSLSQSEAKTRELENQLETLNKVSLLYPVCNFSKVNYCNVVWVIFFLWIVNINSISIINCPTESECKYSA